MGRRRAQYTRPLVMRSATLPTRADGSARIAVVADTHSRPHPRLDEHLAAFEPDAILHAGDIGDLSVLDPLERRAPLFAVLGNIDTRGPTVGGSARELPPDVYRLDLDSCAGALRILLTHIAIARVRLRTDIRQLARDEGAQLVVCGHSHVPFIGRDGDLGVFNPGAAGPRRFTLPIVFGTLVVDADGLHLGHVDCETGQPWSPPRSR